MIFIHDGFQQLCSDPFSLVLRQNDDILHEHYRLPVTDRSDDSHQSIKIIRSEYTKRICIGLFKNVDSFKIIRPSDTLVQFFYFFQMEVFVFLISIPFPPMPLPAAADSNVGALLILLFHQSNRNMSHTLHRAPVFSAAKSHISCEVLRNHHRSS